MSGVPPRGPGKVTLVDAFSALLAAEQGDGSAEASLTAWGTETDASESASESYSSARDSASGSDVETVESHSYSQYRSHVGGDVDAVDVVEAAEGATAGVTAVTSAAASMALDAGPLAAHPAAP